MKLLNVECKNCGSHNFYEEKDQYFCCDCKCALDEEANKYIKKIIDDLASGMSLFYAKDYENALYIFEKYIGNSSGISEYFIGYAYLYGCHYPQDIDGGLELLRDGAKEENTLALSLLAELYEKGNFVERNIDQAIEYYTLLANKDIALDQYKLGYLYDKDKKDIKTALDWYQKAASQYQEDALYRLGECYEQGIGVEVDIDKAFHYFVLSLLYHHKGAYAHLVSEYTHGYRNEEELSWLEKRLDKKGFSDVVQFVLGLFYLDGIGVHKNYEEALKWMELAAKNINSFTEIYIDAEKYVKELKDMRRFHPYLFNNTK